MMSTITDVLSKDHRELVYYYKKVLNAPDNDTATCWQNQFVWALARHLVAEEILGDGGRITADKDHSEHETVSPRALYYRCLRRLKFDTTHQTEASKFPGLESGNHGFRSIVEVPHRRPR